MIVIMMANTPSLNAASRSFGISFAHVFGSRWLQPVAESHPRTRPALLGARLLEVAGGDALEVENRDQHTFLEVPSSTSGAPQVSLIVFLALYFAFLWVAWILAVWVTKPKTVERGTT